MKTKEERAEIQRQRVRQTLAKKTPVELLERAMELYEERNALAEVLRLKQFERLLQPQHLPSFIARTGRASGKSESVAIRGLILNKLMVDDAANS